MVILTMALTLFLIANPIGSVPVFVSLVKNFEFKKQRAILYREAVISAILAYFFLFLGEPFLRTLHIDLSSVRIGGGILVFLISLGMIFPKHEESSTNALAQEPCIVPIATPLISGAGVFATTLVLANQSSIAQVAIAIFIAWVPIIIITTLAAYINKMLGKRALIVMEQIMGMILMMIALNIFVGGLRAFIHLVS